MVSGERFNDIVVVEGVNDVECVHCDAMQPMQRKSQRRMEKNSGAPKEIYGLSVLRTVCMKRTDKRSTKKRYMNKHSKMNTYYIIHASGHPSGRRRKSYMNILLRKPLQTSNSLSVNNLKYGRNSIGPTAVPASTLVWF